MAMKGLGCGMFFVSVTRRWVRGEKKDEFLVRYGYRDQVYK
jgi:hypothetical protein